MRHAARLLVHSCSVCLSLLRTARSHLRSRAKVAMTKKNEDGIKHSDCDFEHREKSRAAANRCDVAIANRCDGRQTKIGAS